MGLVLRCRLRFALLADSFQCQIQLVGPDIVYTRLVEQGYERGVVRAKPVDGHAVVVEFFYLRGNIVMAVALVKLDEFAPMLDGIRNVGRAVPGLTGHVAGLDFGNNCPLSARAYTSFGALLSGVLGEYSKAFQFTRLAIDLAERLDDPTVLAGVYMVHGLFVCHWNEPIDASIAAFRKSIDLGVQHGDHVHASYAIARKVCYEQVRGAPLQATRQEAVSAIARIESFGDPANVAFIEARLALMDWLIDGGEISLSTPEKSEAARIEEARARGNYSFASDLMIVMLEQRTFAGAWQEAFELLRQSEEYIAFSSAFATQVQHSFYAALTISALIQSGDEAMRDELLSTLESHLGKLQGWADQSADNYGHMYLLAAAEHAHIQDNALTAMRLYDEAIDQATKAGFVHIEGLAAERAAAFWSSRKKPEFSRLYVERAVGAFEAWGANGKAELVREAFGLQKIARRGSSVTVSSTVGGTSEQRDALDFATVLKATQTLSGEIRLDRLISSMIDIVLENVGGERAVLVLGEGGDWFVQGLRDSIDDETQVMLDEPLTDASELSRGIANYVFRTGEHVVLENPSKRGTFRNDAYIARRQPRSVLCAPIKYKAELRGLIYLENNQVAGAFTPDRLETLNLLMSQIGVSVENAMLYASQANQALRIEKVNTDLANEIAERKAAEAELSKYKDHLEDLVRQRTQELKNAQGRLVEMSRRSGMAEVAAGVLHNVGNVMNSVNVGAHVARDAVRELRIEQIGKVCDQFEANSERLGAYLEQDPSGKKLPAYLRKLHGVLESRKRDIHTELCQLLEHLEHMKRVIAAQQTYAKTGGVEELCSLDGILDTALAISESSLRSSKVEIVMRCEETPSAPFDRHQLLQILINLISNARHAVEANAEGNRRIDIAMGMTQEHYFVEVQDNGIGIPDENLARIFNHGFTTKKEGHGFGLHNCANSAREMGGSLQAFSDGAGSGARFLLQIPVRDGALESLNVGAAS